MGWRKPARCTPSSAPSESPLAIQMAERRSGQLDSEPADDTHNRTTGTIVYYKQVRTTDSGEFGYVQNQPLGVSPRFPPNRMLTHSG